MAANTKMQQDGQCQSVGFGPDPDGRVLRTPGGRRECLGNGVVLSVSRCLVGGANWKQTPEWVVLGVLDIRAPNITNDGSPAIGTCSLIG